MTTKNDSSDLSRGIPGDPGDIDLDDNPKITRDEREVIEGLEKLLVALRSGVQVEEEFKVTLAKKKGK